VRCSDFDEAALSPVVDQRLSAFDDCVFIVVVIAITRLIYDRILGIDHLYTGC